MGASDTTHAAAGSSPGRPQLLFVKTELQSWLGKKYCDEAELIFVFDRCSNG
jgi:hypothetical protein